jgi:hypothetical protein
VAILINPYAEQVTFEPDFRRYGKKIVGIYGEKESFADTEITLGGESFAVVVLADKIDSEARKEAERIEKYMLRIGNFTAGIAPQDAVKLEKSKAENAFDPQMEVAFGTASALINANCAANGSFISWLRENAVAAFNPVKTVPGKFKCRIKFAGISGRGKIEMIQGKKVLSVFDLNDGAGAITSTETFQLQPEVPVFFKTSGNWQGRLLNWQLIKP